MSTSKTLVSRFWLALAPMLITGCNGGLLAIGASGSSSGSSDSKPVVSDLQVPRSVTTPASIFFVVFDEDGDSSNVQIGYRMTGTPGSVFEPITLSPASQPLNGIPSNAGVPYEVEWDFGADLGSESYVDGIEIELDVSGGISPPIMSGVEMGNDAPEMLFVGPAPAGALEYGANVDVEFTVEDSAGDTLQIKIEYNDDTAGGFPDESWKLARPAATPLSEPTPEYAITGFQSDPAGTADTFRWDTEFDLAGFDADVLVRFTPEDEFAAGLPLTTTSFRIDNNAVPSAILEGGLFANSDEMRGIGIPFTLFDDEGDDTQVVIQWRRPGETFPDLPDDPGAIAEILADPVQRKALAIVTEIPFSVRGRVLPIDLNSVRLPEMAAEASVVLNHRAGIMGDELAILRSSGVPERLMLPGGMLVGPVAALPVGDGTRALVLDRQQSGAGWQLREIDLGSGEVLATVASASGATPCAMAYERGGAGVLVAETLSGTWRLQRVDLASGATQLLLGDGLATPPVYGVESLASGVALVTTDRSLVRVEYNTLVGLVQASVLLNDLEGARGLVADPLHANRVYLAEHGAPGPIDRGRVRALNLDAYGKNVVSVEELGVEGAGFPSPGALALERDGARLLVVTDSDPMDGTRELRGVDIGGPELGEVFEITSELPGDAVSLAVGPEGLRLLALAASNDLAVGGGVEQVRAIADYDPISLVVTVQDPFDPALECSRDWQWSKALPAHFATDPAGATDFLIWDSEDAVPGGQVLLRLTPYDSDRGVSHSTAAAKTILDPREVEPIYLAGIEFPYAVASADLNGDGRLDIVTANRDVDNLAVFFQTSEGEFPPVPDMLLGGPATTPAPYSVAAADLNDDGLMDIVSANFVSDNLAVFFQVSEGVFLPSPSITVGGSSSMDGPISVAIADLNGDGLLDLVSANSGSDNLTVFFQTSPGEFPRSPDHTLGNVSTTNGPRFVRTGDLNGDGRLDIVSANNISDNLTVFFQVSEGVFLPTPSITLADPSQGYQPFSVEAADLNGDGFLDLVSANTTGQNLTVYIQTGLGQFPAAPSFHLGDISTTGWPQSVVAADLNGDGMLDLTSANKNTDNLAVFFQTSPGQFQAAPLILEDLSLVDPVFVVAADLNGDGRVDLLSANRGSDNLSLFVQIGLGQFAGTPDLTAAGAGFSAVVADMNGDGLLDLVSGTGPSLYFQTSLVQFPANPDQTLGDGVTSQVKAADLNGDGRLDLVTANLMAGNLKVYLQTTSGQFPTTPNYTLAAGGDSRPMSVAVADLNGDHLLDLVSANGLGQNLTVYFQTRSGGFPSTPSLYLGNSSTTGWPQSVVAADLNCDGLLDIASANRNSSNLTVFFQTSQGQFSSSPDVSMGSAPTVDRPLSIVAADLNGDGLLDLASANDRSHNLTIFFQTGLGQFETSPLVLGGFATNEHVRSVAAADFDGDGLLDLISANVTPGTLTIFSQTSPGRFSTMPSMTLEDPDSGSPVFVTAADLNSDGQVDIVSIDGASHVSVYFAK